MADVGIGESVDRGVDCEVSVCASDAGATVTQAPHSPVSRRRMAFRPLAPCQPPAHNVVITPRPAPSMTSSSLQKRSSSTPVPPSTQSLNLGIGVVDREDRKPSVGSCTSTTIASRPDIDDVITSTPDKLLAASAENDVIMTDGATAETSPPSGGEGNKKKKKSKMWNHDEMMAYFEAVKLFGKDFDNIARMMAKRKMAKNKNQIKNLYYNSIKFVRQLLGMEDDEGGPFPELTKDTKELFIVINIGEWRRRTGSAKYVPERLRELIVDGSTSIKCKTKKPLIIRTPQCPALAKYFTTQRCVERDKFPSEICLNLRPLTYRDASYVIGCHQNPRLRVRVSVNDVISRIFEVLHQKWKNNKANDVFSSISGVDIGPADASPAAISSDTTSQISVRLKAARNTEVGRVRLAESLPDNSDDGVISINKLLREIDVKTQAHLNRGSSFTNSETSYTAIVPCPFVIDENVLKEGLTMENVGEASIAELYCLCGMTSEISLAYSIEHDESKEEVPESWNVFCQLMGRGFGESIRRERDEETGDTQTDGEEEEEEDSEEEEDDDEGDDPPYKRRRILSDSTPSSSIDGLSSSPTRPAPRPVIESKVVMEENRAFEQQLQMIQENKMKRQKKKHTGLAQSRITEFVNREPHTPVPWSLPAIPQLDGAASEGIDTGNPLTSDSSSSAVHVEKESSDPRLRNKKSTAAGKRAAAPMGGTEGTSTDSRATDFSHIHNSISSAESVLDSLRTPEKKLNSRSLTRKSSELCARDERSRRRSASVHDAPPDDGNSSQRTLMLDLFGEVSRSPSSNTAPPSNSRKTSMPRTPGNDVANRRTSLQKTKERAAQEEDLFGDVSLSPCKASSSSSALFSHPPSHEPLTGSDSMQGLVNNAMSEMMSQSSVDFYKTFQPLVMDTLDASPPKKKKKKEEKGEEGEKGDALISLKKEEVQKKKKEEKKSDVIAKKVAEKKPRARRGAKK